jgi:hypothetical protein
VKKVHETDTNNLSITIASLRKWLRDLQRPEGWSCEDNDNQITSWNGEFPFEMGSNSNVLMLLVFSVYKKWQIHHTRMKVRRGDGFSFGKDGPHPSEPRPLLTLLLEIVFHGASAQFVLQNGLDFLLLFGMEFI